MLDPLRCMPALHTMGPKGKHRPLQSAGLLLVYMGGSQKLGVLFRSPYDKDHSVLGSIVGSPVLETP